jgi:hypothetical protein
MANTYTLIASSTVGSGGAANVQFTSIPATYTDLLIKLSGRHSQSATYINFTLTFNATTTGSNIELSGTGSTVGAGANAIALGGYLNGNSTTASTFGNTEIYIPNYTSTNKKSVSIDSVVENNATASLANLSATLQDLTSAITSITLALASGTFLEFSTAYLYGIKNS